MKTCPKCKATKSVEEFAKDSQKRDGLRAHCRACVKLYRAANAERNKETSRRWREANPERHQRNKDRERARQRELARANPEKHAEKNRKYYQENKERLAAKQLAHRRANPHIPAATTARRRAKKGCVVPQRWKKSECPDNLCYWCGIDLSTVKVHLEHLMPISLGGEAKDYNEAPACSSCNQRKHNKHPLVWLAEQF